MWLHPINIRRPEFGIYPDLLEDEEKLYGLFRMNIEQFYHLSQLVGEEIRKHNTNCRRAISPEELFDFFFRYVLYKTADKVFSIQLELPFFLISAVLDSNKIYSYSS
jgi:hypothetical protein